MPRKPTAAQQLKQLAAELQAAAYLVNHLECVARDAAFIFSQPADSWHADNLNRNLAYMAVPREKFEQNAAALGIDAVGLAHRLKELIAEARLAWLPEQEAAPA